MDNDLWPIQRTQITQEIHQKLTQKRPRVAGGTKRGKRAAITKRQKIMHLVQVRENVQPVPSAGKHVTGTMRGKTTQNKSQSTFVSSKMVEKKRKQPFTLISTLQF